MARVPGTDSCNATRCPFSVVSMTFECRHHSCDGWLMMADCRRSQFERRASPATSARGSGPDLGRTSTFADSGHSREVSDDGYLVSRGHVRYRNSQQARPPTAPTGTTRRISTLNAKCSV